MTPRKALGCAFLGVFACAAGGCKDQPSELDRMLEAGAASAPKAAASAPATASAAVEAPRPPTMSVDETAFTLNGARVELSAADARARIQALAAGAPHVSDLPLELDAARKASAAKVGMVVHALGKANAKWITVHTPTRDRVMGALPLMLKPPAACSAAAYVGKDMSVSVWTAAGTAATRFSKGFAGPDVTLGSEQIKKVASTCDSGAFWIGGDESVQWGLVYDLAIAARTSEAGAVRASSALLLPEGTVVGRKIDVSE